MEIEAYPERIRRWARGLFSLPASTEPALRRAVEARAASLGGARRPRVDLPPDLSAYVDKVALHAYRVEDEDVASLLAGGHAEGEILEITLCAAAGAGLARLELGMAALRDVGLPEAEEETCA